MRTAAWVLLLSIAASPAFAARRVVLVIVDGVKAGTFAQVYEEGRLPNFARSFGDAFWFDDAVSVTPSVTMPSQASIITGVPPSKHGVVGNQWYDRESSRMFDYMTATGISCVYGFSLLGGQVCLGGVGNRHLLSPTIYEAATAADRASIVVFHEYWKGATRPAPPTRADLATFVKGSAVDYTIFDRLMTDRAIKEIQAYGLPSILTVYFAGSDTVGHDEGIAAQPAYLAGSIDKLWGRILDTIESADPQWRDSTMFILTSDHGRTDLTPHEEDARFPLPEGAHLADNGGVGYVYGAEKAPFEGHPSVASVRRRAADESPRAGDFVVTLRPGHYFGNPTYRSEHGSVYPPDMAVPLVVAMPGAAGRHVAERVSVTQIARTIAEYLGFPMESAGPSLPLPKRAATRQ